MAKTGRTPAVIDWDTVGKLLEADCKTVDIARQLGISEMTLYRRCKSDLNVSYVTFSQHLYPLDRAMRKQIEPLRKPYPKRETCGPSVEGDTPVHQESDVRSIGAAPDILDVTG